MIETENLNFVEVFIVATPTHDGKADICNASGTADIAKAVGSLHGVPSSNIYHERQAAEMVAEILTGRMREAGLTTTFKAFRCAMSVTEMLWEMDEFKNLSNVKIDT